MCKPWWLERGKVAGSSVSQNLYADLHKETLWAVYAHAGHMTDKNRVQPPLICMYSYSTHRSLLHQSLCSHPLHSKTQPAVLTSEHVHGGGLLANAGRGWSCDCWISTTKKSEASNVTRLFSSREGGVWERDYLVVCSPRKFWDFRWSLMHFLNKKEPANANQNNVLKICYCNRNISWQIPRRAWVVCHIIIH